MLFSTVDVRTFQLVALKVYLQKVVSVCHTCIYGSIYVLLYCLQLVVYDGQRVQFLFQHNNVPESTFPRKIYFPTQNVKSANVSS